MTICRECGVELDTEMDVCPLCGTAVNQTVSRSVTRREKASGVSAAPERERHQLRKVLWQVTSILLLSVIIATLIIDLTVHGETTWSLYPVTICLVIFLYGWLLIFWQAKLFYRLIMAWFIATIFLVILHMMLKDIRWLAGLGIPILFAANFIGLLFLAISQHTRGLNVLALSFVAIAALCISIESIVSLYTEDMVRLQWSAIVSACLLPVTAAVFFMYYKTRRNKDLQKIFHT